MFQKFGPICQIDVLTRIDNAASKFEPALVFECLMSVFYIKGMFLISTIEILFFIQAYLIGQVALCWKATLEYITACVHIVEHI